MARIGIIGAGVAGLGAAYRLAPHSDVTLFEANERLGGHAHTVDLTLDGHTHGIDIAFLSIHGRTYPRLMSLLDRTRRGSGTFQLELLGAGAPRARGTKACSGVDHD